MLYLYTIMMFAWDLDTDTHSYFREFLDVFINKRKISKELREFVLNTRSRAITLHIRPGRDVGPAGERLDKFNELRISLSRRVCIAQRPWSYEYIGREPPNLIDKIHPPKYYHNARKITSPSRPCTNP